MSFARKTEKNLLIHAVSMTTFQPHPLVTQAILPLPMHNVTFNNPEEAICLNCSVKVAGNLLAVKLNMAYYGVELWAIDWIEGRILMVFHPLCKLKSADPEHAT